MSNGPSGSGCCSALSVDPEGLNIGSSPNPDESGEELLVHLPFPVESLAIMFDLFGQLLGSMKKVHDLDAN
jgi:hypothetical protein